MRIALILVSLTIVVYGCEKQPAIDTDINTVFENWEEYKGKWVRFKGRVKSSDPEKGIYLHLAKEPFGTKGKLQEFYHFLIQEPNNPVSDIFDKYKVGKVYTFRVKILGSTRTGGGTIWHYLIVATFKEEENEIKIK